MPTAFRRQREQRVAEQTARLRSHLTAISQSRAAVRADFTTTGRELQAKRLPAEFLARHTEAVAQFEQRAAEFERPDHQAWWPPPELGLLVKTHPRLGGR